MVETARSTRSYRWRATGADGKPHQGLQTATSHDAVRATLLQQGLRPLHVRAVHTGNQHLPGRHLASHTRQLATMLRAGVPVLQAYDMAIRHSPPRLAAVLHTVRAAIESGQPLHQALGAHPHCFPVLYCNLVAAGEQSGMLDTLLLRLANDLEQAENLRARIKAAMMYPLAVVLVALAVVTALLLFVVPTFEQMFQSLGASLPWPTLLLMQLSQWLGQHGAWLLATSLVMAVAARLLWRRHATMRHTMDRLLLHLPLLGPLVAQSVTARWARTLSTLLAAGIPVVDALASVANAAGHHAFAQGTLHLRPQLLAGASLAQAMEHEQLFPPLAVQMVAIGEASGALDTMLGKAAEYYSAETDTLLHGLTTLLEPLLMVVLGLLIGAVVLALYLPVFSLGQAL